MASWQPVLADGLGGYVLTVSVATGAAALLVAILLELIVIPLVLMRRSWGMVGLIVVANLVSGCLGGLPLVFREKLRNWDVGSDPVAIAGQYWQDFLPVAAGLFVLTCVVECACLLPLSRAHPAGASFGRLVLGTFAANLTSYAATIGIIWAVPPRGTGDFELLPDTSWVVSGERRVSFVDPETAALCSIALNGQDRRIETQRGLGRFDSYSEPVSLYAVIPGHALILYADAERAWHVVENGGERPLGITAPAYFVSRAELSNELPALLPGVVAPPAGKWGMLEGVYHSGGVHYYRIQASSANWQARTHLTWGIGPGQWGIVVSRGNEELRFGIKRGVSQLFCRDPEILEPETLVVFRCGGWIMVMDPLRRKVGRLVRGESMVVETPYFGSPW